jgi:hypothetical protein
VRTARRIYATSRATRLDRLDRRTKESRLIEAVRRDLLSQLPSPSPVQRALVDRAAILSLHVALFDRDAIENGGLSIHGRDHYLAYSNSLTRVLKQLGLKGAAAAPNAPSLADITERIAARRTA